MKNERTNCRTVRMELSRILILAMCLLSMVSAAAVPTFAATTPTVSYMTHIQNIGDTGWVSNWSESGTTGRALRMEDLAVKITGSSISGGIAYSAHVAQIGWKNEVSNGNRCGTSGKSLAIECVKIRLTGALANYYSVEYEVHAAGIGWMGVKRDGEEAGTTGQGRQLEAIRIRLVPKSGSTASSSGNAGSGLVWPCQSAWKVTCYAYYKDGSAHSTRYGLKNAIDIGGGGNIVAAAGGQIVEAKDLGSKSFGKYVVIQHSDGSKTLYAHLASFSDRVLAAQRGQSVTVSQGEVLGVMGQSGSASGIHLHFEYSGGDPLMSIYRTKYQTRISYESNVYTNNNKYNQDKTIVQWLDAHFSKSNGYYNWRG